ncbi:MAG: hypothetical protein LAQ30_11820 [Acidobacteriia bacterium]|nr:hypothetical protein [Terriglobia bacterium]
MHSRRIACFLLGLWLGGELLLAWIAAATLRSADGLFAEPAPAAALHIKESGPAGARLLRYHAAEQVRDFMSDWGLAEIGLTAFLLLFLLFGTHEGKITLSIALVIVAIVLAERLALSPEISALGRMLDFAAVKAYPAERIRLAVLEKSYWGVEILKWAAGALLGVRLMVRHSRSSGHPWKQVDLVDKADHGHVNG